MYGLARAVSQDDVVRRNVNVPVSGELVGDEFTEGPVSLRMSVYGKIFALGPQRILKTFYQAVKRDGFGIGIGDREVVLPALDRTHPWTGFGGAPRIQVFEAELILFRHTNSS